MTNTTKTTALADLTNGGSRNIQRSLRALSRSHVVHGDANRIAVEAPKRAGRVQLVLTQQHHGAHVTYLINDIAHTPATALDAVTAFITATR